MLLAEVGLETNDVCRLANFYRQILGLTSEDDNDVHQVILSEGVGLTVYNDGTIKNNQNQNMCIAFTVEDVDSEYEKLVSLGVTIIDPPTTRPWGARNMHFIDPDGNHIYFRSFPK